jgi:hypothetical protein
MANNDHLTRLQEGVEDWNTWRENNRGIRPDLQEADLRGVHLRGAQLRGAHLRGADLTGADLSEADIGNTVFGDVNLSTIRGLATIKHFGRSTIGIDTLYRSHGNIPEVFLRGAGVPEDFIPYIKSLVGRPFEFYSCLKVFQSC